MATLNRNAASLRPSVLLSAFSGALVPQDPIRRAGLNLVRALGQEHSSSPHDDPCPQPPDISISRYPLMSDSATIVQKLWNYCNVLRDDGLSYQDYIEQLTFLLFLKMADEQTQATLQPSSNRSQWLGLGLASSPRRR